MADGKDITIGLLPAMQRRINKALNLSMMLVKNEHTINIVKKPLSEITKEDVGLYGCFLNEVPVLIPPMGSEPLWTILNDVTYVAPDGTVIEIEAGSKTDLASTPNIVKVIFGGPGKETVGALIHDEGYKHPAQERYNIFLKVLCIPKKSWWDHVFKLLMKMCCTNKIKVYVFHWAVYLFGWMSWWRNHPKDDDDKDTTIRMAPRFA